MTREIHATTNQTTSQVSVRFPGMPDPDGALQWFTGMNTRDPAVAVSGFAEDARYLGVEWSDGQMVRKLYRGKDVIRDYLGAFVGAIENLEYTVQHAGLDGNTLLVEWTDRGRSQDGGEYSNRGVLVFD